MSAGRGSSRGLTPSERFEKERVKYEASSKKFKTDAYSSSDEDDGGIDSGNVLNSVVQSYTQQGGDGGLGRTRGFLDDLFQSGAGICLICIASVKRNDAVRFSLGFHLSYQFLPGVELCCVLWLLSHWMYSEMVTR